MARNVTRLSFGGIRRLDYQSNPPLYTVCLQGDSGHNAEGSGPTFEQALRNAFESLIKTQDDAGVPVISVLPLSSVVEEVVVDPPA